MTATVSPRTRAPGGEDVSSIAGRTVDGLGAISAGEWDALVGHESGPLRHGYLMAWEQAELAGLRSLPAVAGPPGADSLRAACPGYLYRLDLVGASIPAAEGLMRVLRHVFPTLMCPLTYELGSPAPLTNPFLIADPALRPRAVKELITAALEEATRCRAQFLLVQNFTSLTGPAAEELGGLGFAGVPMLPTAVVDLAFDSFDDYLSVMRAQYRRRARQTITRSGHLRVEEHTDFGPLAGELARLWRMVFDRATEVKREILTAAYFRAVSELEASSVLLTRRPDGEIASFALLLKDRPWLSFLHCGFDERAGREEGAYFRLLYEIVRLGIEGGFEQVDLGITTLKPKLDVGGVPVPLFAWVKHRNPLIQRVLGPLASGPMRSQELEARRVFKERPPSAAELVARRGLLT